MTGAVEDITEAAAIMTGAELITGVVDITGAAMNIVDSRKKNCVSSYSCLAPCCVWVNKRQRAKRKLD